MVWLLKQGSGIHDLNNGKCDLWSWIKINSACVLSHFSHVWFFVTPWIIVCPGSPVHGILQGRILEWVAISSSRGIFPTQGLNPHLLCILHWRVGLLPSASPGKPGTWVSCIAGRFFTVWATGNSWEARGQTKSKQQITVWYAAAAAKLLRIVC